MALKTTRGDPGVPTKGRGATSNLEGRFESWTREREEDGWHQEALEERPIKTVVIEQKAKRIIARNDSPDVPFDRSINPYQGCEHGCVYCYARPSHAFLGLSPGLDFETRIFAKPNAAKLLLQELASPGYVCSPITIGGNTDPYQPAERDLRITRSVIEVLDECEHPFSIITKNALIERDIDVFARLAKEHLVRAYVSVTNCDRELAQQLEPRASAPYRRIEAIRRLAAAGVPVGVMVAPIIPSLTDLHLEEILERAKEAGATSAGYVLIRLPHEVAPLFKDWLATHHPLKAKHVLSLVHQMRGGKDYDPRWGLRQRGTGELAELIARRFRLACERFGLAGEHPPLDTSRFHPPRSSRQLSLL